jgi:hypothetical protein
MTLELIRQAFFATIVPKGASPKGVASYRHDRHDRVMN